MTTYVLLMVVPLVIVDVGARERASSAWAAEKSWGQSFPTSHAGMTATSRSAIASCPAEASSRSHAVSIAIAPPAMYRAVSSAFVRGTPGWSSVCIVARTCCAYAATTLSCTRPESRQSRDAR